jgi:hypothetical protein
MRMTTGLPFKDVPEQALLTVSHLEANPGVMQLGLPRSSWGIFPKLVS